jgi:hypothetical protein
MEIAIRLGWRARAQLLGDKGANALRTPWVHLVDDWRAQVAPALAEHQGESKRSAAGSARAATNKMTRVTTVWSSPLLLSMNRTTSLLALLLISAAPIAAVAGTTVAASSIPDGTYTVKVEKVLDAKHLTVAMDNGNETTLGAGRQTIDFSKVQQNDQLKVSIINGSVMVYADLTTHQ